MRFVYQYRTADNAVHDGEIVARSRDDAFAQLKARGIRPSRVDEASGFFNKLFGKGKRWLAIGLLASLLAAVFVALVAADRRAARTEHEARATLDVFDSRARRQPIGDAVVIEMGVRSGWANVFPLEGDRFLASFAIPGAEAGVRSTSVEAIEEALKRSVAVQRRDRIEFRQIKAMVEGMKEELCAYLADGGTIQGYGARLVERQESEKKYYARVKDELEKLYRERPRAEYLRAWQDRNAELRRMGLRLVPLSEEPIR